MKAFLLAVLIGQVQAPEPPQAPPVILEHAGQTWTWDGNMGRYRPLGPDWFWDGESGYWCRYPGAGSGSSWRNFTPFPAWSMTAGAGVGEFCVGGT